MTDKSLLSFSAFVLPSNILRDQTEVTSYEAVRHMTKLTVAFLNFANGPKNKGCKYDKRKPHDVKV